MGKKTRRGRRKQEKGREKEEGNMRRYGEGRRREIWKEIKTGNRGIEVDKAAPENRLQ